jgi:hypothetical protein
LIKDLAAIDVEQQSGVLVTGASVARDQRQRRRTQDRDHALAMVAPWP